MFKIQGTPSSVNITRHEVYEQLVEGFRARQPDDDVSRMVRSGVELVAVSGRDETSPFAEN